MIIDRKSTDAAERRERFCQAFIRLRGAKNAAIAAGYPERSAHVRGSELLHRADVQARLAQRTHQSAAA